MHCEASPEREAILHRESGSQTASLASPQSIPQKRGDEPEGIHLTCTMGPLILRPRISVTSSLTFRV